jgi:lysozyme
VSKGKVVAGSAIAIAAGIVAYWEGYVPVGYADPVSIPTICWGHTGSGVSVGQRATLEECQALLEGDLAEANQHVRRCIRVPLTANQEAALTSAVFNAGSKLVCGSTLQAKANAGDYAGMCAELDRWVWAKGIKLRGLVRRRAAERALCEK